MPIIAKEATTLTLKQGFDPNIFFDPKIFLTIKFFLTQKYFLPNFIFEPNLKDKSLFDKNFWTTFSTTKIV